MPLFLSSGCLKEKWRVSDDGHKYTGLFPALYSGEHYWAGFLTYFYLKILNDLLNWKLAGLTFFLEFLPKELISKIWPTNMVAAP